MTKKRLEILLLLALVILWPSVGRSQDNCDIVISDRAVVQRCITSENARDIAVGMPGEFNFAFDPVKCRLAYVWFGGFLDIRAEATSRGGRKVAILGAKQELGTGELPLRISDAEKTPRSIDFGGYRKESETGIPTFLFSVDGVNIEQRVLSFGADQVAIELRFPETDNQKRFYRMNQAAVESVTLSEGLKLLDSGIIEISGSTNWAQIRLRLKPSKEKFVRAEPTTNGRLLYAIHCMSCHTLDGKKRIGPSFSELWTSHRKVMRGDKPETIQADEAYIRESILQPQAAVVQGYENANKMVDITQTLNEKQIDALVKFLVDLKPKE